MVLLKCQIPNLIQLENINLTNLKPIFIMSTNPISLHSHARFVSKLYSLTGPQENLPEILINVLDIEEDAIRQKLNGGVEFTKNEILLIRDYFKNASLLHKTA